MHQIRILRIVFILLLVTCLGQGCATQGRKAASSTTLDQLRSGNRTLIVGGVGDFPPFHMVDSQGRPSGMDHEIVLALGQRLGIPKIEFKYDTTFGQLGPALTDGTIDMIANNYWITPDRERQYAMTMTYYTRGGVGTLWRKGTGPFDSFDSLSGKRVGVFKGSYTEGLVYEKAPGAVVVPVDGTASELDQTLVEGKVDVVAGFYTRQQFVTSTSESFDNALIQPMKAAFAFRQEDSPLRDAFYHELKTMWADGSLKAIKVKYLTPLEITPADQP